MDQGDPKNTETHVASPANGAEIFLSTFNEDLHVKINVLGDRGVVVLLQINYTCVP